MSYLCIVPISDYTDLFTYLHIINCITFMHCREALLDGEGEDPHLQSNWDDGDGYYKPRMGELIGMYVLATLSQQFKCSKEILNRNIVLKR